MPRYLLSVDGGGIRGIIPATALVALERTTGRPARETFDFVAGTSTGAVIAAAVAAGVPAERILDLYVTRAREVLRKRPWSLLQRIILGHMYSIRALNRLLAEELGAARDWRLNDAPVDVLITAKRLSDGMPWYFVRDTARNRRRTGALRLLDCITASAAAPTYFRPWTIAADPARPPGEGPIGALVDGGVGVAGNPVYQACVEAFFYSEGYTPAETVVVSLGTGRAPFGRRPVSLWSWLHWLLAELLRSPGEQQTELVQRHFPDTPFYRFDLRLERAIPLDAVGQIDELRRYGEQLAAAIDWQTVLSGGGSAARITEANTLWRQYATRG